MEDTGATMEEHDLIYDWNDIDYSIDRDESDHRMSCGSTMRLFETVCKVLAQKPNNQQKIE